MIVFAEEALADLERIFDFNFARDPATAPEHVARVRSAVMILEEHPAIGRPAAARGTMRELVISYGNTGYVALYQHVPGDDQVRVLAVRHQREAGYRGE